MHPGLPQAADLQRRSMSCSHRLDARKAFLRMPMHPMQAPFNKLMATPAKMTMPAETVRAAALAPWSKDSDETACASALRKAPSCQTPVRALCRPYLGRVTGTAAMMRMPAETVRAARLAPCHQTTAEAAAAAALGKVLSALRNSKAPSDPRRAQLCPGALLRT